MASVREKRDLKTILSSFSCQRLKKRGKQEINTVSMSFSKSFYFSLILLFFFVFQPSVRPGKSGQAREGLKIGKVWTSFLGDPIAD